MHRHFLAGASDAAVASVATDDSDGTSGGPVDNGFMRRLSATHGPRPASGRCPNLLPVLDSRDSEHTYFKLFYVSFLPCFCGPQAFPEKSRSTVSIAESYCLPQLSGTSVNLYQHVFVQILQCREIQEA